MLFIKIESQARKTKQTHPDAKVIDAESHGLNPELTDVNGVKFHWSKNFTASLLRPGYTDNDMRLQYAYLRRIYLHAVSKNALAQETITNILTDLIDGKHVILTVKENEPFRRSRRRLLVELFYNIGIHDIETDVKIRPADTQYMDCVLGSQQHNTRIHYTMRGNRYAVIIAGELTEEMRQQILNACQKTKLGEHAFIPATFDWPRPTGNMFDAWGYFEDKLSIFETTPLHPTQYITAEDVVQNFTKSENTWKSIAMYIQKSN